MITFYKLSALIFSVIWKLIAKFITSVSVIIKYVRTFQISKAEQNYINTPNEFNRILYENAYLRNELKKYKQAHAINLQKIHKLSKKHSCFCERLRIVIFRLTHNTKGEELEDLFGYSFRTISNWLCFLLYSKVYRIFSGKK